MARHCDQLKPAAGPALMTNSAGALPGPAPAGTAGHCGSRYRSEEPDSPVAEEMECRAECRENLSVQMGAVS